MRIDHIGIATRGIEESLGFWRDALGLEVKHTETVEEQGVRVAMLPVGEPRVELLEPTGPDSPVAKFLEKRGPGIHHVAVRVLDIRAALARLKAEGARERLEALALEVAEKRRDPYSAVEELLNGGGEQQS